MKTLLTTLIVFIYTISFSQKGFENHFEYMSDLDVEIWDINSQDPWNYVDFYACSEDSEEPLSQNDIDKIISSAFKVITKDFKEVVRPYDDAIKENNKLLSHLNKLSPYYPKRFSEFDSLLHVSNSLLEEAKVLIQEYEVLLKSFIEENICNEEYSEPSVSYEEFIQRFGIHVENLFDWTVLEDYFFDMEELARSMKKYRLVTIDSKYNPDELESGFLLLTGQSESTNKWGLYESGGKKLTLLIPPSYDSIQYHYEVEFAFAWKDNRPTVYYLQNLYMISDEYPELKIPTEYEVPYEDIEFFISSDYWDYKFLYFAKKNGKWGLVNALDNSVVIDFNYNNWSEIKPDNLDFEHLK